MSAEKKLKTFNFIKDDCNTLISSTHDENSEFIELAEAASSFDKEDLKNSLIKLEQRFEDLKNEYSNIATELTKPQNKTCEGFIDEVRNNLTLLKKDIKTSLRSSTQTTASQSNSEPSSKDSNKTNKDFMPEKLRYNDLYSTYIQWRKDYFGYYSQNKFYNRPLSTQRRYLEKLLDSVLRDTLDGQANSSETFPMGPSLSTDQLTTLASGGEYPLPIFPAAPTSLIGILDCHFNAKEPKMIRMHNFQKLNMAGQSEREGWFEAWSRIHKAYQTSGIASMTEEERLKAYLILMTRDKELKQKLLLQKDSVSLQELIDIGKNWQAATSLASNLESSKQAVAAKTSSFKAQETYKQKNMWLFQDLMKKSGRCWRCNSVDCKTNSNCRAIGKICPKCGKYNHFASVCQEDTTKADYNPTSVFSKKRLGPPVDSGDNKKFKPSGDNKKFKPGT